MCQKEIYYFTVFHGVLNHNVTQSFKYYGVLYLLELYFYVNLCVSYVNLCVKKFFIISRCFLCAIKYFTKIKFSIEIIIKKRKDKFIHTIKLTFSVRNLVAKSILFLYFIFDDI